MSPHFEVLRAVANECVLLLTILCLLLRAAVASTAATVPRTAETTAQTAADKDGHDVYWQPSPLPNTIEGLVQAMPAWTSNLIMALPAFAKAMSLGTATWRDIWVARSATELTSFCSAFVFGIYDHCGKACGNSFGMCVLSLSSLLPAQATSCFGFSVEFVSTPDHVTWLRSHTGHERKIKGGACNGVVRVRDDVDGGSGETKKLLLLLHQLLLPPLLLLLQLLLLLLPLVAITQNFRC